MKTLILSLLITQSAEAALKFSHERSTGLGVDRVELFVSAENVVIKKTSNWFDEKIDHRLGEFEATNESVLNQIKSDLEKIEDAIKKADEKLISMGSSFNNLNSNKSPHSPYFMLGGYKIQEGSVLYPRLTEIANRIQRLQLKLVDGVELDKTRKHYVFFKDGKEFSREPFNARFFCEVPRFPTRCLARQWGALYLE